MRRVVETITFLAICVTPSITTHTMLSLLANIFWFNFNVKLMHFSKDNLNEIKLQMTGLLASNVEFESTTRFVSKVLGSHSD